MPAARRLAALLALAACAAVPGVARAAGEPTMPLSDVHPGMRCQGASVVRGTAIATFDVDVIDIVSGDGATRDPFILFRASGPAIDATGIGPGFSGSPIRCPGPDGVLRIAGAISEGIGEFGGHTALATPIASVLGQPVDVPAGTRSRPGLMARARPIAEPLSFGGLSPAVATAVQAAGRRDGRVIYATPGAPDDATFPVQPLVPGASLSAGLSSGDVTSAAIGTVTYVDGDRVWGFGHPLDAAGRRSLFLQDAYVYTVIDNPIGTEESGTYKFAAPGHTVGTLTSDGIDAVAGRLGAGPPSFPLRVVATDADRHRQQVANIRIADESGVGLPTGVSALTQVGGVAVAELAYNALEGVPSRSSAEMCARIDLRESPGKPLRFCNTYVGGTGGGLAGLVGGPLVADFTAMATQLDGFHFGPLHPTGAEVNLTLRRTQRQAFLLGASGPRTARRGHDVRVRLRVRRLDGPQADRTVRVHVPAGTPRGRRTLVLTGTSADATGGGDAALTTTLDLGTLGDAPSPADEAGPRTVAALRAAVARIHRYDGVTAAFLRPGQATTNDDGTPKGRPAYRDARLRLSGQATLRLRVR